MEVHSLTYKLQSQDLYDFNEFHWRRLRKKFLLRSLSIAFPSGFVLGILVFQDSHNFLAAIISCIVITAILWPLAWKYLRSQVKSVIKKQLEEDNGAFVREEHIVTLSDEGVREQTSAKDSLHRWHGIFQVAITSKHLFVHTNQLSAIIIPKTLVSEGFTKFLKQSLPSEKWIEG